VTGSVITSACGRSLATTALPSNNPSGSRLQSGEHATIVVPAAEVAGGAGDAATAGTRANHDRARLQPLGGLLWRRTAAGSGLQCLAFLPPRWPGGGERGAAGLGRLRSTQRQGREGLAD
jgi:hypothetical protein